MIVFTQSEQNLARKFAQEQATREKSQTVFLNTLAVLAVKHCLDILDIPTDLNQSDSWNPFCRMAADPADLWIQDRGTLVCLPISSSATHCQVPAAAQGQSLGYVLVQLDQPYQTAAILGFVPQLAGDQILRSQLQPLEALLINLESPISQLAGLTCLSQWFQSNLALDDETMQTTAIQDDLREESWKLARAKNPLSITTAWKTVESFLLHHPMSVEFAFRQFGTASLSSPDRLLQIVDQLYTSQPSGPNQTLQKMLTASEPYSEAALKAALAHLIQTTADEETRWKAAEILWTLDPRHAATGVRRVMDLGMHLTGQAIALMVGVLQSSDRKFSVLVRLYPMSGGSILPTGVKLSILGEGGLPCLETTARERDNYIQLKLRGTLGEQFGIQVAVEEGQITEFCVI